MIAFGRYSVSTVSNTQRNGWESAMMMMEVWSIHPLKDSIYEDRLCPCQFLRPAPRNAGNMNKGKLMF